MEIPKSSQDIIGRYLSKWRNNKVSKEIRQPFLDIACGDNILKRMIDRGIGFGIDIKNYGDVDVLVKNYNELPFKAQSFNSVAIVASLNYFEDPQKVLSETNRILKHGGILILTQIDPLVGTLWHKLREPWAKYPGFSFYQLQILMKETDFVFLKKSYFMFGLNKLYLFYKP